MNKLLPSLLTVLKREQNHPTLKERDRLFWVFLSRIWSGWRTFINNHMKDMVAVDFLVVPTIRFKVLYVFIILNHARREVVHFNMTTDPTAD